MAEINEWYNQIPPITRYWFTASIALPLLCKFNVLSPYTLILTPDFLKNLELWKPLTATFYYPLSGNRGFHFLTNLYFIYSYSQRLELGHFGDRPADYVFMLIFNWISLVSLAYAFSIFMLMDPMVMSVIYVYCMLNQNQVVSFWFGTRFKARYLPWALLGVNFLLGGGGFSELAGIIAGHLYYFVTIKYPADQGVTLISTPQILHRLLPSRPAANYVNPERLARQTGASANTAPTSYNWGRGRRLED